MDPLLPEVYGELKRLARHQRFHQRSQDTLSTTVLVHEAYLRLARAGATISDRRHLMALCARVMRQIAIDHARAGQVRARHRGEAATDEAPNARHDDDAGARLALAHAFERLQAADEDLAETVELAWFAGLEVTEIAELKGVTPRTVQRDLKRARAWLSEWIDG
jgi:RNA polymerase sigma factor (TIGR02999 family)